MAPTGTFSHYEAAHPDAQLLTRRETARELGVAERTVARWIATGALPVVRIGRVVRIRRSDLEDLVNSHTTRRAS